MRNLTDSPALRLYGFAVATALVYFYGVNSIILFTAANILPDTARRP